MRVLWHGELNAVTIAPDGSAWAVGGAYCPRQGLLTVTEHWDGRTWALVSGPGCYLPSTSSSSP